MTDAAALHGAILTLDSHIDIPWPSSPDPFGPTGRHVDLPKMKAGGLDVGCFVAFVPQGPRTPAALAEAHDRAMAMLETIRGMQGARLGLTARGHRERARHGRGSGQPGPLPCRRRHLHHHQP
jgi:membrane dipeptidase